MSLSFITESPYKKNLQEFVYQCAYDQRTIILENQKAKEISKMSSVLITNIFFHIEKFKGDFMLNKLECIKQHDILEVFFRKVIDLFVNEGNIKCPDKEEMRVHQAKREKTLFDLNENVSFTVPDFQKIEKNIWKNFLIHYSSNREVKLIPYNETLNEKKIKKRIKACDCAHYAFYKINDLLLSHIFCTTLGLKDRAKFILEINRNAKINPFQWFDALCENSKNLLSLLIGTSKYRVVTEPIKNDLIVYFNEKGVWQHFGFFYDSKHVESKWGNEPVFRHFPQDVPYRNSYLILRQPLKEVTEGTKS